MIEELVIRDLGVIREARLALHPGLTVITGETGAGKTMLLTGIDLIRGGRPDPARVRAGAERAEVEAVVVVPDGGEAARHLAELEIDLDEGAVIIGRSVPADGRARARLGARSVPSTALVDLAAVLIAVHGQGEQARLARPDVQRQVLDRVAGQQVAVPYARYRELLAEIRDLDAQIAEIATRGSERAAEATRLHAVIEDVEALSPSEGEIAALSSRSRVLAHAEALRAAAGTARECLSGDGEVDALSLVAAARRALEQESDNDPALGDLAGRLAEIAALLADTAADVSAYASAAESDPAALDALERRRADLTALERRHGLLLDELIAGLPGMRARLADLGGGEERLTELRARAQALLEAIAPVAVELHEARVRAAGELAAKVGSELAALAMPDASVQWHVSVEQVETGVPGSVALPEVGAAALGPHGIDEVALLLSAHRDAPPRPLARAASGGELSRVMLALEVVLAGADPVPTMVFDEVDAGVGGRAAVEVGRRLAALGRTTQVLVVTHLAQVAAFADRHIVVSRSSGDEVTTSDVGEVDGEERVRELARMLAGLDESASAADHARELLDLAAAERGAPHRSEGARELID